HAATEAESLHGGDHGDLALVHGGEGRKAATVGPQQSVVARRALHLLDVDPSAKSTALRREHDHAIRLARLGYRAGQVEPALRRNGIDRRVVDDHLGYPVGGLDFNPHDESLNLAFAWYRTMP